MTGYTLAAAYPSHLRSVRKRVMSHLGGLDLIAFTKTMEAIAEEGVSRPAAGTAHRDARIIAQYCRDCAYHRPR